MSNNRTLIRTDKQSIIKEIEKPIEITPETLFLIKKRKTRKLTAMNYAPIAAKELRELQGLPSDLLSNNASMKAACLKIKTDEATKLKSETWLAEQLKSKDENVPEGVSRDAFIKHNLKLGKETFENLRKVGESVLVCGTYNGRTYLNSYGNAADELIRHMKRINVDMNFFIKFFAENEEAKKRAKKSALVKPSVAKKSSIFKKL